MRVGLVHNEYGVHSGEEGMFYRIGDLLQRHGHDVFYFTKSSRGISDSLEQKAKAFFAGIYSVESRRQMRQFIEDVRPDVIQIQNLYPLISPSVLLEIARYKIPVVMRCANYRLICPNGLLLRDGKVCHRCVGGKEWWCFLKNCEKSLPKSLGYAVRHYVGRRFRLYERYVTRYYTQTQFQKNLLTENGFDANKIDVIPNMIPQQEETGFSRGNYVGYLGRISEEKGVQVFLQAARRLKEIPFKLAGSISMPDFDPDNLPANVEYMGFVEGEQKSQFIRRAAMMVVPSICYEGLPSSILESMNRMTPVISSSIGGLGEVVQHEKTGLCFEAGNSDDLVSKIELLIRSESVQRQLCENASLKLKLNYTENTYYQRLIAIYNSLVPQKQDNPAVEPTLCLAT